MNSPSPHPDFDKVLEEHKAVKELLERVDRALSERTASIAEAGDLLAALGDRLVKHFALEEEGDYFADAVMRSPQLIARANDLMAQHPKMCTAVRDLAEVSTRLDPAAWWEETSQRFARFKVELLRHERLEDGLLQEAYNQDIGSSD
jgi:hypothetical protein